MRIGRRIRKRGDEEGSNVATGPTRIVIVGGGMAAQRLVEKLTDAETADHFAITLLSDELSPPYDRVHLGAVLEGAAPHTLALRSREWHDSMRVELRLKDRATEIDRKRRAVWTESGGVVAYDRLVIATGAEPLLPPVPGIDHERVVTYRTLDDVERIAAASRDGGRVVLIGGGLLAIEAARSLQKRGCPVAIVERAPRLLPRQLDVEGASVLEAQIRSLGIDLHIQRRVMAIEEQGDDVVTRLDDGTRLAADLVVVAAGVRPRDALAREAGIRCGREGGIVVDDHMATSDPHVDAIGECVRHRDESYGFVAPCYGMADALAARLLGTAAPFQGAVPAASLKVDVISVSSVGEALEEGTGVSALSWSNDEAYRRIVLRDGRMVGAIAVGSGSDFPRLQEAVARGARVGARKRRRFANEGRLWRDGIERPLEEWPAAAVVCTCTGVTCGALRNEFEGGARTSFALSECTGAGSVCGSCKPLIEEIAGERSSAKRGQAGIALGIAALVGLAGTATAALLGPVPMATSVEAGPSIDFLWRDGWWKQASGFTLLGLCVLSLALSLRKRWKNFSIGTVRGWRIVHSTLGVATIVGVGVHTGFRMGVNLNFALMASLVGVVLLGSLTALVTSLEHRLPAPWGGALRRSWTAAHVVCFWPMPVLVLFHVLSVYMY